MSKRLKLQVRFTVLLFIVGFIVRYISGEPNFLIVSSSIAIAGGLCFDAGYGSGYKEGCSFESSSEEESSKTT